MPDWKSEDLAKLPREGEFYLRGSVTTRLENFVDAAFAFAVTLLVISVDSIPDNYNAFIDALLQSPAFVACFFQLIMFWLGHRTWSRRYGLETSRTLWISLLLVGGTLIIVYPLRVMFGAGIGHASNEFFPSPFAFTYSQIRIVFILYGSGFGFLCALIAGLFWEAWRNADQLALTDRERFETRADIISWMILTSMGIVAMLIAVIAEDNWVVLSGWIYLLLAVIMPLHSMIEKRAFNKKFGNS